MPFTEYLYNQTFTDTNILHIHYKKKNHKSQSHYSPRVKILFHLTHRLVPIDFPPISSSEYCLEPLVVDQCFTQPLRVFGSDENSRRAFEFGAEFDELHWGNGLDRGNDPIRSFDELVEGISKASLIAIHEALVYNAVKSIEIMVYVVKWSVVDSEWYNAMVEESIRREQCENEDFERFMAALEMRYDGDGGDDDDGLECSICLGEVLVGTRVSSLPCSHRFHQDCVVTWLNKTQTCPLCRLELIKEI